jgi:hypothetical protein
MEDERRVTMCEKRERAAFGIGRATTLAMAAVEARPTTAAEAENASRILRVAQYEMEQAAQRLAEAANFAQELERDAKTAAKTAAQPTFTEAREAMAKTIGSEGLAAYEANVAMLMMDHADQSAREVAKRVMWLVLRAPEPYPEPSKTE